MGSVQRVCHTQLTAEVDPESGLGGQDRQRLPVCRIARPVHVEPRRWICSEGRTGDHKGVLFQHTLLGDTECAPPGGKNFTREIPRNVL